MGHGDIAVTLKVYSHLFNRQRISSRTQLARLQLVEDDAVSA
jgi:hypothetical protein